MKKKISTKLIRSGINQTQFMETSESLFLTSGFTYKTAKEAEQAFKEEKKRFMYSRFGNPTVEMLQRKLADIEGAEECWATASGMSAFYNFYVISKER